AEQAEAGVADLAEIDYLLAHLNRFARRRVTRDEVVSTFAGYRPLLKLRRRRTPARLSRTHAVVEGEDGMLTIAGGKLTTYRRMAEDTVNRIDARESRAVACPTRRLLLAGGERLTELRPAALERAAALGLTAASAEHLLRAHGGESLHVLDLIADDGALGTPIVPRLPYLRAEVVRAVRAEQALTVEDVLARRTHVALEDDLRGMAAADEVAALMGRELA